MTFPSPHPKGFSLVELLSVLTILAILGSLSIRSLDGVIPRQRFHQATSDVALAISAAREMAITLKKPVRFVIIDDARSPLGGKSFGWLLPGANGEWDVHNGLRALPENIQFGGLRSGTSALPASEPETARTPQGPATYRYVEFTPTGAAASPTGRNVVELVEDAGGASAGSPSCFIQVSAATGRVRVASEP